MCWILIKFIGDNITTLTIGIGDLGIGEFGIVDGDGILHSGITLIDIETDSSVVGWFQ